MNVQEQTKINSSSDILHLEKSEPEKVLLPPQSGGKSTLQVFEARGESSELATEPTSEPYPGELKESADQAFVGLAAQLKHNLNQILLESTNSQDVLSKTSQFLGCTFGVDYVLLGGMTSEWNITHYGSWFA